MAKGKAKEKFDESDEKEVVPKKEFRKSSKNNLIDAISYISNNYELRFNEITKWVEAKTKDGYGKIEQREFDNLLIELELNDCSLGKDRFGSLLGSKFVSTGYNPISDFIGSLPKWDGKDRIPEFLKRIELHDESERELLVWSFKKWFVAMMGSILDVHVINHTAFILQSFEHGVGKSSFLEKLCPPSLYMDYNFVGHWDPKNKDHYECLGTKILITMDDLDALNKPELGNLKSVMTQPKIEVRRPYARASIKLPRLASLLGSTNEKNFLPDYENRRFLPFEVKGADFKTPISYELLYSQAVGMYKEGFQFWFDRDEIKTMNEHTDRFRRISQEEEMIKVNFRVPTDVDRRLGSVLYLFTSDIMHSLASKDEYRKYNVNNSTTRAFGIALRNLGFNKVNKRGVNGKHNPLPVWEVVKIDKDDADRVRKGTFVPPRFIDQTDII